MEKGTLLYEGKAKKLYVTDDSEVLWVEYCDQATALNGARKEQIAGKGALNNQITSLIFERLNSEGITTHFIKKLSKTEQLNEKVEIIPLEVVLRNVVAGSFAKRFGLSEGFVLPAPIVEFYYKNDDLDDPFINDEHVKFLNIATDDEIAFLKSETRKINEILKKIWLEIGLTLVDFKLEFGRLADGTIILADEISPDTSRLWDAAGNHMDKDVFRRNIGDLIEVYSEVLAKLQATK
ncbi:phosphoribosylaminoimidazolesuccinocarboxamide synthase [Lactococcus allomyrinae]|uniref:Phosphoribosylaminoimidazole-succinocarboxamide synthase n=1 Tax=Lactococcus allomyrinae TaxID=2419773 RepID=A0A387BD96_9LACT|nr:phosphoribosylaminoimidazolesuccinocarboxamide synthase [Lactococcus allomyrinae]AYG00012.1 phosphoribosylaminoimidazolesuccinocarboxamide synthase [Lactococcus allomyrinae]